MLRISKRTQKTRRLRGEADELWTMAVLQRHGFYCLVCGKKSGPPHHFFPKGSYGHLRYDTDNGIPLCVGCHHRLHNVSDPVIINTIVNKKGKRWYDKLEKKAKADPGNYRTDQWYRDNIEALKKEILKRAQVDPAPEKIKEK